MDLFEIRIKVFLSYSNILIYHGLIKTVEQFDYQRTGICKPVQVFTRTVGITMRYRVKYPNNLRFSVITTYKHTT